MLLPTLTYFKFKEKSVLVRLKAQICPDGKTPDETICFISHTLIIFRCYMEVWLQWIWTSLLEVWFTYILWLVRRFLENLLHKTLHNTFVAFGYELWRQNGLNVFLASVFFKLVFVWPFFVTSSSKKNVFRRIVFIH